MTYTVAQFFLLLCAGACVHHGDIVQVPMPPQIVSYTRGPEHMPSVWHQGRLYVLVPESSI